MADKPAGPRFKLGDTVLVDWSRGTVTATIIRVPKRRSTGLVFGGDYAYDVQVAGTTNVQRTSERHLRKPGEKKKAAGAGQQ